MDMEKETGLIKDNGENYDEVTYGCDKCDFDTCSREKMASHRQNRHVRYQCKKCDFAASIRKELKNHKLYTHKRESYQCLECDIKALGVKDFKNHMIFQHEVPKMFLCTKCNFKASLRKRLYEHQRTKHEGVK